MVLSVDLGIHAISAVPLLLGEVDPLCLIPFLANFTEVRSTYDARQQVNSWQTPWLHT